MILPFTQFSPYTSIFSFIVGLPTMIGAYYQSWRARKEARLAREGAFYSADCLEFVVDDGTCINLVPLETLHSLPKPGDIVLLPGDGTFEEQDLDRHVNTNSARQNVTNCNAFISAGVLGGTQSCHEIETIWIAC